MLIRSSYLFYLYFNTVLAFLEQSVRVKGRLRCGNEAARNVLVKLVDKDNGQLVLLVSFIFKHDTTI